MPRLTLPPGTRLGGYEIVSALAAGGMGEVYRARDSRLDRQVAIKLLPGEAADPDARERLRREAMAVKKMSRDGTVLPFSLALVHLGLGDRVRALVNLERARAADSQMMRWIGRDTIFDSIRSQPRFAALLNKMSVNR